MVWLFLCTSFLVSPEGLRACPSSQATRTRAIWIGLSPHSLPPTRPRIIPHAQADPRGKMRKRAVRELQKKRRKRTKFGSESFLFGLCFNVFYSARSASVGGINSWHNAVLKTTKRKNIPFLLTFPLSPIASSLTRLAQEASQNVHHNNDRVPTKHSRPRGRWHQQYVSACFARVPDSFKCHHLFMGS